MNKNSDENKNIIIHRVIAPLCLERLAYLNLSNLNIVASKIGCRVEELHAFLYANGMLTTDQLNKLGKLCNIELVDIIQYAQKEVSEREKKVVDDNNPGLDDDQKENVYDILSFLDDISKKPKR